MSNREAYEEDWLLKERPRSWPYHTLVCKKLQNYEQDPMIHKIEYSF